MLPGAGGEDLKLDKGDFPGGVVGVKLFNFNFYFHLCPPKEDDL
jgi:hypothetical protein